MEERGQKSDEDLQQSQLGGTNGQNRNSSLRTHAVNLLHTVTKIFHNKSKRDTLVYHRIDHNGLQIFMTELKPNKSASYTEDAGMPWVVEIKNNPLLPEELEFESINVNTKRIHINTYEN